MKPPFFIVCADGEVLVYEDAERALRYVESPDLESGEYPAAFDAEGRRLRLEVKEQTRRKRSVFGTSIELTPVILQALEHSPTGADELRALLVKHMPGVASEAQLGE